MRRHPLRSSTKRPKRIHVPQPGASPAKMKSAAGRLDDGEINFRPQFSCGASLRHSCRRDVTEGEPQSRCSHLRVCLVPIFRILIPPLVSASSCTIFADKHHLHHATYRRENEEEHLNFGGHPIYVALLFIVNGAPLVAVDLIFHTRWFPPAMLIFVGYVIVMEDIHYRIHTGL